MPLPTPSVTQPRLHLWSCPPLGTTAVEQHGAFLPINKLYIAGSIGAPTSINHARNMWPGYNFATRTNSAANFALRFVDDHLEAMKDTWGLADAYQNALFHIAFTVGTGTGIANLLNHADDAITGSYRALDRTLFTKNGIADVAQLFDPAGYNLPGVIDARLVASSNTAFRPLLCCQDMEFARSRAYDACNTGTNGNWSGQTGDARAATETVIADLTGPLALTPTLGHNANLTLADIDAVMTNFGNTNLDWADASNITAAREYEAWSMAVDDNAMARAVYQHLLAVWGAALCGNYDTCGFTNAVAPHRYHGAKLGAQGQAAAAAHLFGAQCPVLYPLEDAKLEDTAELISQGWTNMSPTMDTLQVSKKYCEAMILGMRTSAGSRVPWVQLPGIGATSGGAPWVHQVEFSEWLLTRLFTEKLCSNIILWDWEADQDWDLVVAVVNKAAANAGISWSA